NDVVDAFARSIDDAETFGTSLQLGGPDVYSMREIVNLIGKAAGVNRRIIALPDALARMQAFVMDFVPGKPFSTDNYLSLTVNSICDSNGFDTLGIQPASAATMIPRILQRTNSRGRLDDYRRRPAT
ncbi:MAG: complex I NDUFA9 subunit family protein, partial [Gammaproteobacteria bacterium]|nr:complex I NDUFA9 subunit family protein [Gammaproteobacteria bacterium]